MTAPIRRREALAAITLAGLATGCAGAAAPFRASAHPRIGVSSNSFRDMFAARTLDMFRYPAFVKGQLGLTNLELISVGFAAVDDDYCRRIGQAARDEGCRIINLLHTDQKVDLIAGDAAARQAAQDVVKRWMDRAALIGSPSFRSNANFTRPTGQPEELERVVSAYRPLAEYGRTIGVKLLVENHQGFTSTIDNTIAVIRGVNSPNFRGIADWGNSGAADNAGRVADIQRLMPYVDLVSAKGVDFDADNHHVSFDHAALVQAAEAGGYRGLYSIDLYAAPPPNDPVAACKGMIAVIEANLRRS